MATHQSDGVSIVDVTDKTTPVVVGSITNEPLLDGANDIVVSPDGSHIFVTGAEADSLVVVDVTDPQNPGVVGSLVDAVSMDSPGDLAVSLDGNFVYVTGQSSNSVAVVDVTVRTAPVLAGSVSGTALLDYPIGIAVAQDGKNIYVIGGVSHTLVVINVEDETTPTLVGSISGTAQFLLVPAAIASTGVADTVVVVSLLSNTLDVFDVSDATNPTLVESTASPVGLSYGMAVDASRHLVYAPSVGTDTLTVFESQCQPPAVCPETEDVYELVPSASAVADWTLSTTTQALLEFDGSADALRFRGGAESGLSYVTLTVSSECPFDAAVITAQARVRNFDGPEFCKLQASTDGGVTWTSPIVSLAHGQHVSSSPDFQGLQGERVVLLAGGTEGWELMLRWKLRANDFFDLCYIQAVSITAGQYTTSTTTSYSTSTSTSTTGAADDTTAGELQ